MAVGFFCLRIVIRAATSFLLLLGLDAVMVTKEGGMYLLEKALLVTIVPIMRI